MMDEKKKLLARVAYLYYVEGKKQSEIAKELDIYRTSVSRMLKQALAEDIVKIEIVGMDPDLFSLEQQVKSRFKLKQLEIVPANESDANESMDSKLAQAAGYFIKKNIEVNSVVGLAWGATLANAISKIETKRVANTTFVPIVGGPSHLNSQYHVNTLVYELARKFQGKSLFINATVVQENKGLKRGIFNSKYFVELRSYWEKLDMVIVGIGGPLSERKSQWRDLLTEADYEDLKLREAVGDCCCRFFDAEGKALSGDLYDRTIGLKLNQLAKVPQSVGIARGKSKAKAILAMLRKGYINCLITDEETIREVLRLAEEDEMSGHLK